MRSEFEAACIKYCDDNEWFKKNKTMTMAERAIAGYFWQASAAQYRGVMEMALKALQDITSKVDTGIRAFARNEQQSIAAYKAILALKQALNETGE